MRSKAVLVTLALSFVAPLFVTTARAAENGASASSQDSSCKRKRAKKSDSDGKDKKKDKDGKKPYGFEL